MQLFWEVSVPGGSEGSQVPGSRSSDMGVLGEAGESGRPSGGDGILCESWDLDGRGEKGIPIRRSQ